MSEPAAARPRRSVMVTGAGTGIGRSCARALLDAGFDVTLAGRRTDRLVEAASPGGALHPHSLLVPTDVTDPRQVDELFARHLERFERVDVLFNNAGTFGPTADVAELDAADWRETWQVNVTGAVLCAGAALRAMAEQRPAGGRIINNGSVSAQSPRPRSAAYTTTKHAIAGLSKSIELDGRAHGVSCTQLDIGNARSDLTGALLHGGALQADGSRRPEPSMDASHVAALVVQLAGMDLSASVPQLTVTAAAMPFIGRG